MDGIVDPAPLPRLAALRSRDFRLLWIGSLVSGIGSQMQMIAVNWQTFGLLRDADLHLSFGGWHLTLAAQALGLGGLGLVRALPILVFALIGGVLADSIDRRRLILWSQGAAFLVACTLAAITLTNHAALTLIYALSAADAGVSAFSEPALGALVPHLVPRAHLTNAASLSTLVWSLGTIAGSALAGIMVGAFPLGLVYGVNAFSFLALFVAAAALHIRPTMGSAITRPSIHALLDGLRFTRSSPIIWSTMLLDFWATFFASSRTMLPIVANQLLHVGVQGYGLLATAQPIGAVLAGVALALRRDLVRQGVWLLAGVVLYGAATALFGISTMFVCSYLLFALTGVGDTASTVVRASIRQVLTPDEFRGRLNSVHMMLAMCGPQLGELEAGLVAATLGVSVTIVSGGVLTLALAGWILLRYPRLWRYRHTAE